MISLPPLSPVIEISILTIVIYYFLSLFWNNRSMDLLFGCFAFLLLFAISSLFDLPILHKIVILVGQVMAVGIVVIFQPELRLALSKLSLKNRKLHSISDLEKLISSLTETIYTKLADKGIGALIAIENNDSLEDYAEKAIRLNAIFSPELLEAIFVTNSPLHDGAVIFRGKSMIAAAVILPLPEESGLLRKSMGTRHRAALGLSEQTDALVIAISEEKKRVSIAREGEIHFEVRPEKLKGILRSVLSPKETSTKTPLVSKGLSKILKWIKR